MKTQETTTTNLAEFGWLEREELILLLREWHEHGLPKDFEEDEVTAVYNKRSGYVFLTNSEYQTAMMNGNKLEIWHHCPNCGHEGFQEDCQLNDNGCNECHPMGE